MASFSDLPLELKNAILWFFGLKSRSRCSALLHPHLRSNLTQICAARLEVVSKAWSDTVWTGFERYEKYSRSLNARLTFLASKPQLLAHLKTIDVNKPESVPLCELPHLQTLVGTARLTALKLPPFDDAHEVFNHLAKAPSPVRYLSLTGKAGSFYLGIQPEGFENLRQLKQLVLHESGTRFTPFPADPVHIMTSIAENLGDTLEMLTIDTNSWAPLLSMKALKELFISCKDHTEFLTGPTIPKAVEAVLGLAPPGVGMHLAVQTWPKTHYNFATLFSAASNAHRQADLLALIDLGFDPTRHISHYFDDSDSSTHLQLLLGTEFPLSLLKAVLQRLPTADLVGRSNSLFFDCMTAYREESEPLNEWEEMAACVFEETRWNEALRFHPRDQLLPPYNFGASLIESIQSNTCSDQLISRIKFMKARPAIFGELDLNKSCNATGCNALHTCTNFADPQALLALGVDWRSLDIFGHNALYCQAKHPMASPLAPLLASLDDREFVAHADKAIWGSLRGHIQANLRGQRHFAVRTCVQRLVTLMPNDRAKWKELLAQLAHVQLRFDNPDTILDIMLQYDGPEHEVVKEVMLEGLLEPFDLACLPGTKYPPFYNKRKDQPLPHILAITLRYHEQASQLVERIKKKLGREAFIAWAKQTNGQGETWEPYVKRLLGTDRTDFYVSLRNVD